MPTVLSDLFSSKKFLAAFALSVLLLAFARFGYLSKDDVLGLLKLLWPVYLGAQGLADLGKAQAVISAALPSAPPAPESIPVLVSANEEVTAPEPKASRPEPKASRPEPKA